MQKVLIVRFSSIGDIVLTSPVVRCLSEQTGAEVHFLTKAGFAGIVEPNPHITKVWTIEKHVTEIISELRQEGFTQVIDLHRNLRTRTLALLHWQPKYYRFNKLNWAKYLLTRWKVDRMPDLHIVDRYLDTVRPLGVINDGKGLDYFTKEGTSKVAMQKLRKIGASLPDEPYLAFVIGAAHATKRLTEAQIVDFCRSYTGRILLLGGPAEADQGDRIAKAGDHVINTCGKFKLSESAELVKAAAAVLTHDTGLMHIAAAYRKPIVSIWGNTVPAFGMYPYLPGEEELEKDRRIETLGLECRPCSKIGHQKCPQGHFRCIREIEVADIIKKLG
ncbi:glycosyl transferase [Lewinellaceae bacterium SD302]|nr:glycosyl transferase [Lewinellaceae bacterium SD302]